MWLGTPGAVAHQDVASLVSGAERPSVQWGAYIEKSVAGSTHAAEMPFVDQDLTTGSISGSGLSNTPFGAVAFRSADAAAASTPDEARVSQDKGDRVISMPKATPPKAFSADSLPERASYLMTPDVRGDGKLALLRPEVKPMALAGSPAFRRKEQTPPPVPTLARLGPRGKQQAVALNPEIMTAAYATSEAPGGRASPFSALLKDEQQPGPGFIPPRGKGDHWWMSTALPDSVYSAREQQCLANAIYFEARGESDLGQAAVAQVVLNRVRNPAYPNTICGVVYQNKSWKNRCQFSFACDGIADRILSPAHYRRAKEIAMDVTTGKTFLPEVGSATHYYAQYVSPGWARSMKRMTKIGLHIFYRTYGGGWS